VLFEDDGVSEDAPYSLLNFSLVGRGNSLDLDWQQEGTAAPVLSETVVILPEGERRTLTVRGTPLARGATVTL
jgi:alpha-glucosidase